MSTIIAVISQPITPPPPLGYVAGIPRRRRLLTFRLKTRFARTQKMFFRTVAVLVAISVDACRGSDPPKPYGSAPPAGNGYHSGYEPEFQRPLAVFTEKPVNVAGFVLIPVIQVPSSDLRMIYRPQIDSVSKTEPIVMCKSSTKSVVSMTLYP